MCDTRPRVEASQVRGEFETFDQSAVIDVIAACEPVGK